MLNIIAETNHVKVVKNDIGTYDVWYDNLLRHPNLDSQGVIRALSVYLMSAEYKDERVTKNSHINTIKTMAVEMFKLGTWDGRSSAVIIATDPQVSNPSASFVQKIAEQAIADYKASMVL